MFARMGRWPVRQRLLTPDSMEVNSVWEKSGICQAVETKEVRVPPSDAVLVKGSQFRSHNSKFTLKLY